MTTTFHDEMHHLKIELLENGLARLENESMGESYMVDLHPMQLRYIAAKMGLVAEVTANDAELLRTERGRLDEMKRDMDRYKRALLNVRTRAEQLYTNVYNRSQEDGMDLGIEIAQAAALADLADFVCAEFEGAFAPTERAPLQPLHPTPANASGVTSATAQDADPRQLTMQV